MNPQGTSEPNFMTILLKNKKVNLEVELEDKSRNYLIRLYGPVSLQNFVVHQ